MSNGKFAAGQLVLVPDSRLICRPCCVVKCNGYPPRMTITLEPIEGGPRFSPSEGDAALISEVDPLALEGTADLVKLSHLNEFAILQNLRARYARDEIYTAVGTILMAVNPFKDVSSGDDSVLQRACTADAKAWDELPPHVYVLAENAYRAALRERKPQAILISGESGAGKTESTKLWLHHLVKRSARAGGGSGGTASHIETALLHCNPVLETFGNAATTRNTNSSRFGKWIEVSLDARAGGTISSARLTSYLLERSRVTGHAPGERAFHAFYQLLAAVGSGKGVNGKLALEADPAKYRYMRAGADGSGVAAAVRREDAERRATCVRSLQALGFAQAQLESLDAVVASVLHLGNVSFESHNAGEHQVPPPPPFHPPHTHTTRIHTPTNSPGTFYV
ncbi:P-loop containing nucleoside triphosphate hydrolase protein [Pavlovales sp. CCMP2436]|nr:P-loop containing nucleoside triphosphate hydrolase protein [Pavlovales sp. CCMP2436]